MTTRVDNKLRTRVNKELVRHGLDGNGKFERAESGYSTAVEILARFDIELGEVVSSHLFNQTRDGNPQGQFNVDLAFTNHEDSFSPELITNSMLALSYYRRASGTFEVLARLT